MRSVNVELLGAFRGIVGKKMVKVEIDSPQAIGELIRKLCDKLGPRFKSALIDPELNDPRPNALILVNGREISALSNLDTMVKPSDTVTLVPVSHGG